MSEIKLKRCPFCGVEAIYKISREDYLGTVIPQLFCNSCKMIFEVENDSPYLDDAKTHDYLKEKLYKQFNTRKPMEDIVDRLEDASFVVEVDYDFDEYDDDSAECVLLNEAIEIVKEVGGMDENCRNE